MWIEPASKFVYGTNVTVFPQVRAGNITSHLHAGHHPMASLAFRGRAYPPWALKIGGWGHGRMRGIPLRPLEVEGYAPVRGIPSGPLRGGGVCP